MFAYFWSKLCIYCTHKSKEYIMYGDQSRSQGAVNSYTIFFLPSIKNMLPMRIVYTHQINLL